VFYDPGVSCRCKTNFSSTIDQTKSQLPVLVVGAVLGSAAIIGTVSAQGRGGDGWRGYHSGSMGGDFMRGGSMGGDFMRGRGMAFVHYKHNEAYVAMGAEVAVERASGRIKVERIVCAHDCGLIVNPDGVRAQVEGNILQTLSRVMMEEVTFDRARVTSLDWGSYPIMRFSDIPKLDIDLVDRKDKKPVGAGEAACTPVGAVVANAVYDAVGVRIFDLPLTPEKIHKAIQEKTKRR